MALGHEKQNLLLHCCCAPCAGHVIECLMPNYNVTLFFYNPNIWPADEYDKRKTALVTLLDRADFVQKMPILECEFDNTVFDNAVLSMHNEPEGGARCSVCYEIRLRETALRAKVEGFDIFTTTLSVSPHKKSALLNEIGNKLSEEIDIKYLEADFKKRDGYKRSVELSREYEIYRQNYCGCEFSK